MREQQYRLKTSTLVIAVEDGKKTSITIPHGGEVEVLGQLDGFLWRRKTIKMFTTAIRNLGEQLDGHNR
jgi:hypothetical protein